MTDISPNLPGFPPLQTIEFTVVTLTVTPEPSRFFIVHETSRGWTESRNTNQTSILCDLELAQAFPTVWDDVMPKGVLTDYKFETKDFGVWKFFRRLVFEVDRATWEAQTVPPSIGEHLKRLKHDDDQSWQSEYENRT